MRYFWLIVVLVAAAELVVAAGFFIGYLWLGGWLLGLVLAAGLLVLMILPWIGDLAAEYDSVAGRADIKLAWWGGLAIHPGDEPRVRGRFFLIPWRSRCPASRRRPPKRSAEAGPQVHRLRTVRGVLGRLEPEDVEGFLRMVVVLGVTAHELLWGAREFYLKVQGPTQVGAVDGILAGVVGARLLGPVKLAVAAGGARRVHIRYRIGLFQAALAGLYLALEARPRAVLKSVAALREGANDNSCSQEVD